MRFLPFSYFCTCWEGEAECATQLFLAHCKHYAAHPHPARAGAGCPRSLAHDFEVGEATYHDRSNGGSTIFHVDSGQQRPLVILDLHLDASATLFMNSTDASVVDRILLLPDVENVYGQGLVVGQSVTSDNRISFLFPIQAFHLGLEIKITQALSVPLWIWTI